MKTVVALTLLTGLLVTGGTGMAIADDGAQLTVTNTTVEQNGTSTLRLALSRAPAGLSGYEVTLELSESGVAEITAADYPESFQLTTEPEIASDAQRVTLEAAITDMPPGATNVTLAMVNVTGIGSGTTEVRVADAQVDADNGSRVAPAYRPSSVTVEPLSNDGGTNGNGDTPVASSPSNPADELSDDESTTPTGSTLPGFGVVVALGAVLAVALLVRRRR